jgi:hypothetical protein
MGFGSGITFVQHKMLDNNEGKKCNLLGMSQQSCNLPFKYYEWKRVCGGFFIVDKKTRYLNNRGKIHIG